MEKGKHHTRAVTVFAADTARSFSLYPNQEDHMRTASRIMFCFVAAALLAFTPFSASAGNGSAGSVSSAPSLPVVQLKHWQNSATAERHAFLMGFVSMLQLESAWQGKNALPVEQSTATTWMRGLSGVSIPQMDSALNDYIAKHPAAMERSVLETLGRIYVRPKLSQKERDSAAKRYDVLKADFHQ